MGTFKRLILQIKGIEDKNDLVNNWSTAYVGAFKRLILRIDCIEEKMTVWIIDQLVL